MNKEECGLDATAKEALRDLSHLENYLEESDAPANMKNRAVDVRLCIKELREGVKTIEDQAAANKAAEEGGLPFAELSINQKRALSEGLSALEAMADIWSAEIRLSEMAKRIADAPADQRPGTIAAMIEQAFIEGAYRHFLDHKDAADRASRQVANKAEVEQCKIDAERYRWLQREAERDYVQFTVDSHREIVCECKEALDETIDAAMGIATPPATTGASTVLTDERKAFESWKAKRFEAATYAGEDRYREFGVTDQFRAFKGGLEVAAQAGQVAVSDTCVLPPEGWYCTRPVGHDGPCAAWPCDQKVEYSAAPSPAKESK